MPEPYQGPNPNYNMAPSYPAGPVQSAPTLQQQGLGQALNNQSQAVAGYQGGAVLGNYQTQSGLLNQDMANQLAALGIDASNLGIQEGALQRAGPLAEQMNNLQTRGYDVDYNATLSAEEGQRYGAARSTTDLYNSQAARGSMATEGTRRGVGDINEGLKLALQGIGQQRDRIGLGREAQSLSWEEKKAQLADQQKFLDNAGKKLGLSRNEIVIRTQQALSQLGLSTFLSVGDIMNQLIQAGQGSFGAYVDPNVQKVLQQAGLTGLAGMAAS